MGQFLFITPDTCMLLYSFFFFDVDHFKNLYWICHNIAFVLCFGLLAPEACGMSAPDDQRLNTYFLHQKAKT